MKIYLVIQVTPDFEDVVACFATAALANEHIQRTLRSSPSTSVYRIDPRTVHFNPAPIPGYNP